MNKTKYCFAPVVDRHTRVLILGSLPGEVSLARAQYYGHPQNRFWHLLGRIVDRDLPAMDYPQRLQTLLAQGIGLWDVVAEANRQGSLDSSIRDHVENDLCSLVKSLPALTTIAFNGNTAAKIGLKQLAGQAEHYRIIPLPSSSPAYTLAFEHKFTAWAALRECLLAPAA